MRDGIWDPDWCLVCLCVWVAWVSRVRAGRGGAAGGGEWGARDGHVPLPSLMSGHDQRLHAVLIWTLKVRLHATLFLNTWLDKELYRTLSHVCLCLSSCVCLCDYEDGSRMFCDLYVSPGHTPSAAMLTVAPQLRSVNPSPDYLSKAQIMRSWKYSLIERPVNPLHIGQG